MMFLLQISLRGYMVNVTVMSNVALISECPVWTDSNTWQEIHFFAPLPSFHCHVPCLSAKCVLVKYECQSCVIPVDTSMDIVKGEEESSLVTVLPLNVCLHSPRRGWLGRQMKDKTQTSDVRGSARDNNIWCLSGFVWSLCCPFSNFKLEAGDVFDFSIRAWLTHVKTLWCGRQVKWTEQSSFVCVFPLLFGLMEPQAGPRLLPWQQTHSTTYTKDWPLSV